MAYQGKYTKPSSGNPVMRIAFLLLCLLIVSMYMTGGLLAKYHATGSGKDSARVANFDIKVTGTNEDMNVVCGETPETGSYTVTVENDSEVAVRYTITVEIVPDDGAFSAGAISYTVTDGETGELPVGPDETKTHTLTFEVADWAEVTKNMTGKEGELSFSFTVTVDVAQID